MADWENGTPPVGVEIEYERDGRTIERGTLDYAGKFGIRVRGAHRKMEDQFRREGISEMFSVSRWRRIDGEDEEKSAEN